MTDPKPSQDAPVLPGRDSPLVYSCSGCSSAAQLANALAIRLDRLGAAEMSCVAGLGGDVSSLVRLARSGRPILALDGCPLICVAATLRRHGLTAQQHLVLSDHGIRKRRHADYDQADVERLLPLAVEAAAAARNAAPMPDEPREAARAAGASRPGH